MTSVAAEPKAVVAGTPPDHRGSWVPTWSMVTTRMMELRRRRGLMITLLIVVIGLPWVFLGVRLIMHAADPRAYGAAGGEDVFTGIVAGVLYVFGFVAAAMVGCTASTGDLSDGMFRHLVVTGRSRLALYLARLPAGLAIVAGAVAAGYAVVCLVCCLAAPTDVPYDGVNIPPGLSQAAFATWSVQHADEVVCNFNYDGPLNIPCGPNGLVTTTPSSIIKQGGTPPPAPTKAQLRSLARAMAAQNYAAYAAVYRAPPDSLMVGAGLWLLLQVTVGFVVGLGLGSLLGQRTVSVILMVILEIVLTPLVTSTKIPYLLNAQRGLVGIAMAHLEPNGLSRVFGAGGGPNARSMLIPESTVVAIVVVIAWVVVWTVIGARRMVTRDA